MELYEPFPRSKISQTFNQNANPLYASQGLKGHTSIDYNVSCGTPVYNLVDGAYCYSVMNKDNANLEKYRAVFTLFDDGDFVYEISYGHAGEILAEPEKTYKVGALLMKSGNTGDVYQGGVKVTNPMREAGGCPGGHLHGPQVRKCRKVKKRNSKKKYLTCASGILKWDGCYIEIVDYDNGFNGCVDPMAFYNGQLVSGHSAGTMPTPVAYQFRRDLQLGSKGEDVRQLQKWLNAHGYIVAFHGPGSRGAESEYFGGLTRAAVADLQRSKGISPAAGYVGPKTRGYLNAHP